MNDKSEKSDSVTLERSTSEPYDQIWDAIPLFELLDYAVSQSENCSPQSNSKIRECAEKIVRDNICFCCRSNESIIENVTDEFVRQMQKAHQDKKASELSSFKKRADHGNCTCNTRKDSKFVTIGVKTRSGQENNQ